jgi:DNA-directed RNA polymerase alpha subunit
MEFSNDYAQLINENFNVMNKFWNASLEQNSGYTKKNMELFFDHMNRNVEFMHETWNNTASTNDELRSLYRENLEKFNNRYQKVYDETMQTFQTKEKTAAA